jgi:hypothetical protein
MIDITGLDKAQVLFALWQGSHCQGMSFLGMFNEGGGLTLEKAQEMVNERDQLYFDYVAGHVIKCDITNDEFDERLYDRDCGEGRAAEVISALRNNTEVSDQMDTQSDLMRCLLDMIYMKDKEKE